MKCVAVFALSVVIGTMISATFVQTAVAAEVGSPEAISKDLGVGYSAGQCSTGAGGFVALECFNQSRKLQGAYTEGSLGGFLNRVFVGAIALGAMLAVLRLAWAGFVYMGTDMWGKKEQAKEIIRETLLGLFLLIAVYLILNQINPQITSLNVTDPPASVAPGSTYDATGEL